VSNPSSKSVIEHLGLNAAFLKCAVAYNFRCRRIGLPTVTWLTQTNLRQHGIRLFLRVGTSDYPILKQIFVEDEYAPLKDLPNPQCIVDCGANVGYSSLYFARLYPQAHILAVEPDEENAAVFMLNLARYQDRVELLKSAVWSRPARLVIRHAPVTMEAAIGVREALEEEREDLVAIDMPTILDRVKNQYIDLLKIDIEGSERELFREPECHRWLPRVRNIAIELHDDIGRSRFLSAMHRYACQMSESGELTICKGIGPRLG
jgi:FkbM family methyltransferase